MKKLLEFSKYIYTLQDVLNFAKDNKYDAQECRPFEVYHAYVGRHDQPGVYDKRACMIVEDLGKEVSVYKITAEHRDHPLRYLIQDNRGLNFKGPSYIRMDEDLYTLDKKWLTMFDGDIKYADTLEIKKLLNEKDKS